MSAVTSARLGWHSGAAPATMKDVIGTLVSACLAGRSCLPPGEEYSDPDLVAAERRGEVVAVCPALEGGLCFARDDVYLDGGAGIDVFKGAARVRTSAGQDITDQAVLGVVKVMAEVRSERFSHAILQAGSALCGVESAPDRLGVAVGDGLLTAALRCQGVTVREVSGRPAEPPSGD